MSIYNVILSDVENIIRKLNKKKLIYNIRFDKSKIDNLFISHTSLGESLMKDREYVETYGKLRYENDYAFMLFDDSLIRFRYDFEYPHKKCILKKANISYYPNPEPILKEGDIKDDWYKKYVQEVIEFDEKISLLYKDNPTVYIEKIHQHYASNYSRLDYSNEKSDFSELTHSYAHIHLANNNNFRLTSNNILVLSEFMRLVFFLYYNNIWSYLYDVDIKDEPSRNKYIEKYKKLKTQDSFNLAGPDIISNNELNHYYLHL